MKFTSMLQNELTRYGKSKVNAEQTREVIMESTYEKELKKLIGTERVSNEYRKCRRKN